MTQPTKQPTKQPKRMLIAEEWDKWSRRVLPANCSHVQRVETRRAFYGGASAILIKIIESLSPGDGETDEDLDMMAGIHQELMDFAAAVKERRA